MSEAKWRVQPSSYRMSVQHKPVVIYYDPNPGGTKHPDGTTTYSLNFPALVLTEWVAEPEKVAQMIVDVLNRADEKPSTDNTSTTAQFGS